MRWFGVAAEADRVVAVGEPCDSQDAAQDWAEWVNEEAYRAGGSR